MKWAGIFGMKWSGTFGWSRSRMGKNIWIELEWKGLGYLVGAGVMGWTNRMDYLNGDGVKSAGISGWNWS